MNDVQRCLIFTDCDASLCPLDNDLTLRIWYADEPVCRSRKHGQHRWIRKQRSIQRRKTKAWFNKPIAWQMLYDASRPMQLTDAQRKQRAEYLKIARGKIRQKEGLFMAAS